MSWTMTEITARLGASTNVYFWEGGRFGRRRVAQMAEAGIGNIEISVDLAGHFDHNDRSHIAEIKDACRRSGAKVVSLHAPDLPWASPLPEVRKGAIKEFLALCEAAEQLGGPLMVCHFDMDEPTESFIRDVLPLLEGTSVRLTIENGENLQDYAEFVDRIGFPRFGMIVDIGHTKDEDGRNPFTCADRARKTIQVCGDRLFHLHLHEFWDGADHWPPFYKGGLIEWGELFAGLADIDYAGAFMFESVPTIPNDPAAFDDNLQRIATFPAEFARLYGDDLASANP